MHDAGYTGRGQKAVLMSLHRCYTHRLSSVRLAAVSVALSMMSVMTLQAATPSSDGSEAAILNPVCSPAGTTVSNDTGTVVSAGAAPNYPRVCTVRSNFGLIARVLGYIDTPVDNEIEIHAKLRRILSGESGEEHFLAKRQAGSDDETLIHIPGKHIKFSNGSSVETRGVLRQQNRSLKGVVYQMRQYFPVIGHCVYMMDVRRDVDTGFGTRWTVEATYFEPKSMDTCIDGHGG